MMKTTTIYFDMDGTIADLYAKENWLECLEAYDVSPYEEAKVMLKMNYFARMLNRLQKQGYRLGIISWLSKSGNAEYNAEVTQAKLNWLKKHLASVNWDEIHIIKYGTPKSTRARGETDILFDDEERNRREWKGQAYTETDIMNILKAL